MTNELSHHHIIKSSNYLKDLINYVKYNLWANQKICDFLKTLSDEEVNKEIMSSFSSLQKTLIHVWDAQVIWLTRLQSEPIADWELPACCLFKSLRTLSLLKSPIANWQSAIFPFSRMAMNSISGVMMPARA